jgi:hypothetical protein
LYAKIYEQIFDSSIADDWQVRHVFEDMIKLAKHTGVVNMTHSAIASRTRIPLKIVRRAISELEKPDSESQSKEYEGRRIVRLDDGRNWGWFIVNHGYYRKLRDEEHKRASDAERQRKYRETKSLSKKGVTGVTAHNALTIVSVSDNLKTLNPGLEGDTGASIDPPTVEDTGDQPFPPPCPYEQFLAVGKSIDMPESEVMACWDYWHKFGWKNKDGRRIFNATSTLRAWRMTAADFAKRDAAKANFAKPKRHRQEPDLVIDGSTKGE